MAIEGTVSRGFEPVREVFAANFQRADDYRESGAGFVVYHRGEQVVALSGGHRVPQSASPWTPDTLVNVWSTTKGATAIVLAWLVDRGELDYEAPVATYWPEFGANGKAQITVGQALSHQAGLSGFLEPVQLEDLYDRECMVSLLAGQMPLHTPGEQTVYHAMTFGFIADEIARRITGSGIRALLATELKAADTFDFRIGVGETEEDRVAPVIPPPMENREIPADMPRAALLALTNPLLDAGVANCGEWKRAELPAANGHATADGIARLYHVINDGATPDGSRILGAQALAALKTVRSSRVDGLLGLPLQWCSGIVRNNVGLYGPNPDAFGHSGWGGSFGCADAANELSMGYICSRMGGELVGDPRSTALCAAVYRCLEGAKRAAR